MKQFTDFLRGRPWLMLLLLLAWLVPQKAAATYVDEKDNYTVMLGGSNIVYFSAPAYDQEGADCWIQKGILKVTAEGVHGDITVLTWEPATNIASDATKLSCKFGTTADGFIDITQGNSKNTGRLTKASSKSLDLVRNTDGLTFEFSAEWVVPYNLLGKKLTFTWDVTRTGNARTTGKVPNLKNVTIDMPEASAKLQPFLSPPMLNPSNPGKLELPWFLATDDITSAYYEYDDVYGKHHKEDIRDVNNGIIALDASAPHKNLRVVCSYKEKGDKGEYPIEGASSETQQVGLIHSPAGLTVRPLGDQKAKVELKWTVPYMEYEDLVPTDFFEIQRSLTGKEEDFETIGSVFYAAVDKKSTYTYIDSTLIGSLTAGLLENGGNLGHLTYRVRRAVTQDWGWGANNGCAATTPCVLDNLHLMRIADYSAKWEDRQAYSVRVSWDYTDDYNAVWDDRAKMQLRVIAKNRAGDTLETKIYTLDENERQQRYKVVSLTRSCVYYDIDVYVERDESPLNFSSDAYYFPIRTAGDWETFRKRVEAAQGKYDVNARLYANIVLNYDQTHDFVGSSTSTYYRGVFDGNGHTLYFTKLGRDMNYFAPFRCVGNATIKNLRTAGEIANNEHYSAGLIAMTMEGSTVNIENCRSSMTLRCYDIEKEGCLAGFVALVNGSNVIIKNSKFDGSFIGTRNFNHGGYVAWVAPNSQLSIVNSLFAPKEIKIRRDGCATWARLDTSEEGKNTIRFSLVNSYATEELEEPIRVIRSVEDWNSFRNAVDIANGAYDVDARLDADITVTDPVGSGGNYFWRGTFDGNGHTLNVNINNSNAQIGPFRNVGTATIKDLRVTGTVKGGIHAGGLIGVVASGGRTVTLERVWVSTDVTSTGTHAGGVIGHSNYAKVQMNDVRFDGQVSTASGDNTYAGEIIGWCNGGEWTLNRVYDAGTIPANSALWRFFCIEYNGTWSSWGTNNSSFTVTQHGWTNVNHYNKTDQNEVLNLMNGKTADTWKIEDGKAVPVMHSEEYTIITNEVDLLSKLGDEWKQEGDILVPVTTTRGEPNKSDVFGISSAADWERFRDLVQNARGNSDVNAELLADITTNLSIGWGSDIAYRGTFNGNNHTINFNISDSGNNIALFRFAKDYTIKNLHLTGSIKGGIHSAGLVGNSSASSGKRNTLTNCHVSVSVECSSTHAGGFIGHGLESEHTITNCLFDGSIKCSGNNTKAGAFIGWANSHAGNIISNCLENGSSYEANTVGLNISNVGGVYGNSEKNTNNWTYHGWSETNQVGTLSPDSLLVQLGNENWHMVDGNVVPVMVGVHGFYHANNGKIDNELLTTTRQSSVLLAWNTDGNPIDYFTVMRRVKGEGEDKWVEVATHIDQMSYEDQTVSPLVQYQYKVLGVNDCEGVTTSETEAKDGACKNTGRVEGYVRFNDGTGASDIEVDIIYDNKKVTSVKTDETGYFEADELSYQGKTAIDYEVKPVVSDQHLEMPVYSYLVTFNATSNDATVHEFTITNGRRFSGYVMYDGTSIPVKGVNFMVNGKKIHDAKGDFVESDYDGSFSFRVVEGNNTIQAVKNNHVFVNHGWYKNSNKQSIKSDVSGIYFYDSTKVTLIGRVVGGDDQGSKPLMNNLSKNNLGDSIKMVLTLEGDNTSWLVYDNLNPNRTQREEVVRHPRGGDKHFTEVTTQRKRMEVLPDPKTGEYMLLLPPVRWKVQQVYCKGYPTLFKEGQGNEVIDLTNCLVAKDTTYIGYFSDVDSAKLKDPKANYHAIYNRIYHNPVEVTYKQLGYDTFDYFGDRTYTANELTGNVSQIPLVYGVRKPNWPANRADSIQAVYSLKYPVFSVERKYRIRLQVGERYQYNNDPTTGAPDLVPLTRGVAYMHNGMRALSLENIKEPQMLDSLGQATFVLQADQTTKLLTAKNALKTVTFTVMHDSTFIEAEPLRGYVLNMFPVGESQDIMTEGKPILYDVLRDPPGSFSSNTLAKGATINYTYMMNLAATAGVYINYTGGTKLETLTANAAIVPMTGAGTVLGPINRSDIYDAAVDFLVYSANGSKAFSHTMVVGNNISTSGDPSMVGADADLYIGSVHNVVVTPMSTIRAVNDKMFQEMIGRMGRNKVIELTQTPVQSDIINKIDYGTVVEIARGDDDNGETIHLVRDVALGYGPKVESQFVYSQKQLLTQIIPTKAKEIADMMYLGSKTDAQTIADRTQRAVYLSLRQPTEPEFAVPNTKNGSHYFNLDQDTASTGINYLVVLPAKADTSKFSDEVVEKYEVIKAWIDMISQNEAEKLQALDLLANYDVAGAQGINYSETFDVGYNESFSQHFPVATEVDYFGLGQGASNAFSALAIAGRMVGTIASTLALMKTWKVPDALGSATNLDNGLQSKVIFGGKISMWSVVPVLSFTTLGTDSEAKSYNRTESFTLATDPGSRLNVDVYRSTYSTASKEKLNIANIFTNDNFNKFYEMIRAQVNQSLKSEKIKGPRGFIFRTRGGATQNPWEDQRVTMFHEPGSVLDARTLKICNPKIRLDKQSVSGVAIDDAAHFTVYLSNESEKPEATDGLSVLQLFAPDQSNPLGAKMSVNGQTLTTSGMPVTVVPGTETALQLEVRAGQGFDYEGLVLGVMSPSDADHTTETTTFDVHFLREAGGVNVAVPGDKWVLNTNAQKDSERGWYIPVTINGFDRHQHNFDHIEFQYKESQRGDDSWTNLCSYYANDSLMARANGVRKLIPANGNIVTEFFGEGWLMERSYDLRAVLFCRNGSDFLTTSSKIITGVKDTRRPQLFGTPEPKSGLLTQGDDIVFNFSEDIEYNYLSAITNFEVKGEVNNGGVSEAVSVQFDGQASVESDAKRNFSGKDLTIDMMVKPNETGRDMPLFSHGTNGDKLQLWLTKDFKLKAVVDDQTFISDSVISHNAFQQVAMVIDQTDSLLTFFMGGVEIGRNKLNTLYNGTGTLIFGRTNESDRSQSQYYEGRMMEARLWYSAMDGGLIGNTYGGRHLTGYEKDLVDYYPMNEGSGKYAIDYTQGANAKLIDASWAIPRGISLRLEKADKGVLLDKNAINRTNEEDYTLMFWFKTDAEGRGTLLSNGRGLKEDMGARNQFNIGFEDEKLMYRSNGFAIEVPGNWSDNAWHNFAMTVNRARNVANIYVDKEVRATFEVDTLGGISGGYPLIGAVRYDSIKANGDVVVMDGSAPLKGNVDELMFFAQALPQQLISTYATKSPNGDEAGLLTYLSFDRQERQKDNSIELVPYVYSRKLYLDDQGKPRYQLDPMTKEPTDTLVRDYLFVDDMDVVLQHFDANEAAPMVPYEEVTNLKFSFIGKDNQVMVELDEPAARLNHRNIYVTLRDVEDKNGNTMASPQTVCYYVTNSSLEWLVNRADYTTSYGEGDALELPFYNKSASTHTYTIENCPRWLTLNNYSDVIAPQGLAYITATISKNLNIGTYNEILYLTDEDGIIEPFYLNLTVEGEQPEWATSIDGDLLENSMSISGQVYLYDQIDTDPRDIVGVFDRDNVCHGFANISYNVQTEESALYLTVYDNIPSGRELSFRLWLYSTGREIVLTTSPKITFQKSVVLGTDKPVRFEGSEDFVQKFNLKKGWNWVSFNLVSKDLTDVNSLLSNMSWKEDDILTDLGSSLTLVYKNNQWIATDSTANVAISPKRSYAIKVQEDCTLPIGGSVIKKDDDRTINLNQGWNAIGYTPMTNLTVETALSDYFDEAEPGDVIKSHTEFAYFTKQGNTGRWRGSLQYMKPGEGYLMLRKSATPTSFTYPYYELSSDFREDWSAAKCAPYKRNTMSVSATVVGFEPEEGDRLVAYADDEVVGNGVLSMDDEGFAAADGKPVFYLSIAGDSQKSIRFAIERDGEIVASSDMLMDFQANAVVGSPDVPTAINFMQASEVDGKWYTIGGVLLPQKPTLKGLYIHNGKKVVIK